MKNKQVSLLVLILVVVSTVIGGGAWWYYQNQEDITPKTYVEPMAKSDIVATLSYQQGAVEARKDGADWQTVETDTVLHQGDSVRTGADSKAIIELENGDVVRLGYNTEAALTTLQTGQIVIAQVSGASYNRVAKDVQRSYKVVVDDITVTALGTAFDVVEEDATVNVNVVESKVKINTTAVQNEVQEGKTARIRKQEQAVAVEDMDTTKLENEWYTWNKEEDSKKTDKLGVLSEYAGPAVTISSPVNGYKSDASPINVMGSVADPAAVVTVNGETVMVNDSGAFSAAIMLSAGKNIITIIATDTDGHRSLKEIKVQYQARASATPIQLTADTQSDGVHLSWNASVNETFQYYKVVRSETNANLDYPDDGYIVLKNADEESYVDTDVSADKAYYYRVCEVMSGDKVFCSNVVHMLGKKNQAEHTEQNQEANQGEIQHQEQNKEQNADTAQEKAPQDTGPVISAKAEDSGVGIWWTDASDVLGFKYYKVVRSKTNANLTYPDDGYLAAKDASINSYRDYSSVKGTSYYYRVCAVGDEVYCSNVVQATAINSNTEPDAVTLSASYTDGAISLSWNVSTENDFKYYKVVWSDEDSTPEYPTDGYLTALSNADTTVYEDDGSTAGTRKTAAMLSAGTHYYSVCVVDQADQVACSNVVILADGVIQ